MKVVSTNISEKKGTTKHAVPSIRLTDRGIEKDAHAGTWHRQVSLLAVESIKQFEQQANRTFNFGDFAENITTEGIALTNCAIRDLLTIGPVELEVTQIGKQCHGAGCAIFQEVGRCVMPKQGIFCRVLSRGDITPGSEIVHTPRPLNVRIITLSDRASRGEYEDRSGPAIQDCLAEHFAQSHWSAAISNTILPDESNALRQAVQEATGAGCDILFTTGGTGIGPRDVTTDVIRPMLDKEIPGIMEHIRGKYAETIPSAQLSRSIAGLIGTTLVYVLPGSVKAVREYCQEIQRTLDHALRMLAGIDSH